MATTLDYYSLLGIQDVSGDNQLSPQTLKGAYRRALLQHHPDKSSKAGAEMQASVDDVALAYKTLSDPKLRAEYDQWLLTKDPESRGGTVARPRHTGLETVDLDDLAFDPVSSSWSRGCRCGESKGYVVFELELEKYVDDGEIIVGCKGCSLWLRVLYDVEE
jgi:diphthamide biosynthesis protein 4